MNNKLLYSERVHCDMCDHMGSYDLGQIYICKNCLMDFFKKSNIDSKSVSSDNKDKNSKYYIYSYKHSDAYSNIQTFWKPNSVGYTDDLEKAGIYTQDDYNDLKEKYPLIESGDMLQDYIDNGYDTFFIKVEDVEFLGKKKLIIFNY